MKQKMLLLLKGMGLSIGFFVLWRPISRAYGLVLNLLLSQFHPMYHLLKKNEQFPYLESLLLIPFISLTIVTPKITVMKKVLTISIMVVALLLINFIAVMYAIDTIENNPSAFIAYRSIKLIVPFLIWVMMSYPFLFGQTEGKAVRS